MIWKLTLIFTIVFINTRGEANAQYLPVTSNIGAKGQLCSHTDEINGFSVIWHTNCTGFVSFVLNVASYPTIGRFWVAMGFDLLSTELALVEVVNGIVSVSSAKYYKGQPPIKSESNVILNPHGAIFSGNILEATFAIHQSLLGVCKDWTFYTIPTPIGSPYVSTLQRRRVCNVAETCSRNNCIRDLRLDYINYDPLRSPPLQNDGIYDHSFYPPIGYSRGSYSDDYSQWRSDGFGPLTDPLAYNELIPRFDAPYSALPPPPSYPYLSPSSINYAQYYVNNARAPPISQLLDRSSFSYWPRNRKRRSSTAGLAQNTRVKRQMPYAIRYPDRLKGTAYEGQDAEFVRKPQQYYYNNYRFYNDQLRPSRSNYLAVVRDDPSSMYYPYRTLFTNREYYDSSRYRNYLP